MRARSSPATASRCSNTAVTTIVTNANVNTPMDIQWPLASRGRHAHGLGELNRRGLAHRCDSSEPPACSSAAVSDSVSDASAHDAASLSSGDDSVACTLSEPAMLPRPDSNRCCLVFKLRYSCRRHTHKRVTFPALVPACVYCPTIASLCNDLLSTAETSTWSSSVGTACVLVSSAGNTEDMIQQA